MGRKRTNGYYNYPPHRYDRYDRYPARYRREGCLERIQRFFTNVFITIIMVVLAVIIVGFTFTHFQQVVSFVLAVFAAISFLISIFPRLLFYGGILAAIFAALFVIYGLVKLISSISEQMSLASRRRAETALIKANARQEKEKIQQVNIHTQREQVRLAQTSFDYDQRVRDRYKPVQDYQPRLARTEDLAPKDRTLSTWQGAPSRPTQEQDPAVNRQQYGYPSRRLHRTQLTQAAPLAQPSSPTARTTEDLDMVMKLREADGTPDDTILVPDPAIEPRQQFVNPITGKFPVARSTAPASIAPATDELVQRPAPVEQPQTNAQQNQFSQLAQVRKKKK